MSKKNEFYVSNKELLEEIYKSREQDEPTRKLVNQLMIIAQRSIQKLYYKCDDDRENSLSEAYYDIAKYWKGFDPDYSKYHGFEKLVPGDVIRVLPERGSDRTASATVVESYLNDFITEKCNEIIAIGGTAINCKYDRLQKEVEIDYTILEEGETLLDGNDAPVYEYETEIYDVSEYQNIKVDYIVKKNHTEERIFDQEDIIIKMPNPFSFYTSLCTNGFAKGWKRYNPPKAKGLFLSLDSGFDTESDGCHTF